MVLARYSLRIIVIGSCVGAALWSSFSLYTSWNEAALNAVSARIIAGEPFKADTLRALDPVLVAALKSSLLKPDVVRSVAIIRLREAELDIGAGHAISGNPVFSLAETTLRSALEITPSDPFFWFGLAWCSRLHEGFNETLIPYLEMSYAMGEHEGWIAVHRNALAVTFLPSLPADLQVKVVAEFRNLVESNYIPAAAQIATGPGWGQHEILVGALGKVSEDQRRQFARTVFELGADIDVPGIERHMSRPWKE